jgi:glycerol-3-phosphate cytidylyltransferase-like family protein/SAM-dependent methyltransferase
MILGPEELAGHAGKVAMVDGGFDPLHAGHLAYFQEAAKLGLPLLCNVRGDDYITGDKSRPSLLPEIQRASLIDALKPISYVHLCKTSTADVLRKLKPAMYVKGSDWKSRGLPPEQVKICAENGVKIVYLDTVIDSSTSIVKNFLKGAERMGGDHVTIAKFEEFLFSQKEVSPDSYDHQYFQGDWRAGQNSYSIEKRREIEAKNPQNIKDVFNPKSVLDVGCGPGALMLFMHELGLSVWGVDISEDAKKAAHPDVRDRIAIAPVTEFHDFGRAFDLVVCREVLEHLTVLQVQQAVRVLARYTSKFLYITTRFHPEPKGLLDVTNDFANDPTHITAMNKDFLRVMFLLEGLRSRPDLEAKMDWKNFGRVLVFEKK